MKHQRLKLIIFCSNEFPGLTSTFSTARSNFATFIWENVTMMNSMEILAAFYLEMGLLFLYIVIKDYK